MRSHQRVIRTRTRLYQAIRFWSANRGQGILGVAGVVIGIVGLVFASAIGEGAKADLARYIESMGAGVAFVRSTEQLPADFNRRLLNLVGNQLVTSAGLITSATTLDHHRKSIEGVRMVATEPDYASAMHLELSEGRFLQPVDLQTDRQIVVVSQSLAHSLMPFGSMLDEDISVNGSWYRIVGVVQDNHEGPTVYFPRVWDLPREYVVRFVSEAALHANLALLGRSLESATNGVGGVPEIVLPMEAMRDQQRLRVLLQRVLAGFAIVVLVLGGLSVTNTMLMSVMTRRHEIGLRLALGATRSDIVAQFVIESLVICGVGGLVAIGVGALLVFVISPWLAWSLVVNLNVILTALAVGGVVSAAAGGLPALRASQVQPAHVLA